MQIEFVLIYLFIHVKFFMYIFLYLIAYLAQYRITPNLLANAVNIMLDCLILRVGHGNDFWKHGEVMYQKCYQVIIYLQH